MTTVKAIIQRNLPLSDTYTLVSYRYASILNGNGECCDNCGKLISNIVTVANATGKRYTIGTDCANTLLADKAAYLFEVLPAFDEGKALRKKILSTLKKDSNAKPYIYTSDNNDTFVVIRYTLGYTSMHKVIYTSVSLPYLKDLLTTPTNH